MHGAAAGCRVDGGVRLCKSESGSTAGKHNGGQFCGESAKGDDGNTKAGWSNSRGEFVTLDDGCKIGGCVLGWD